ncbi:MAG: hypothetical protein LBE33_05315 [Zoogloeaceae bacterium]|jgi:hypothetical protein|nr:hypothetical protein [Zoogloeaceae bacterium]
MATEYETFMRDPARLLKRREVVLCLRDLTPGRKKYRGLNVRATVSQPPHPGEDVLWVRSVCGVKQSEPYGVKIVERLPDVFQGAPYTDFFAAMERAE